MDTLSFFFIALFNMIGKMTLNFKASIPRLSYLLILINNQKNACEICFSFFQRNFSALLLVLRNYIPPKINKVNYINFLNNLFHLPNPQTVIFVHWEETSFYTT